MAAASPDGPAPLTMAVRAEDVVEEDVDAGETVRWLDIMSAVLYNGV